MTDNLINRLRTEANSIDDTGDVELRKLLADAAETMALIEARLLQSIKTKWAQDLTDDDTYSRAEILDALDHEIHIRSSEQTGPEYADWAKLQQEFADVD